MALLTFALLTKVESLSEYLRDTPTVRKGGARPIFGMGGEMELMRNPSGLAYKNQNFNKVARRAQRRACVHTHPPRLSPHALSHTPPRPRAHAHPPRIPTRTSQVEQLEEEYARVTLRAVNQLETPGEGGAAHASSSPRPSMMFFTCFDEREESFRNHLESAAMSPGDIRTFGVAGFFNMAIWCAPGGECARGGSRVVRGATCNHVAARVGCVMAHAITCNVASNA
mgnify:CR=1 FL=1